jgi:SPX domain protein involved in polyphosphate accumulation
MIQSTELEGARYEVKFVTEQRNLNVVLNWVKLHSGGFRTAYDDRWVNNIYFDKHNYFAYTENISGASVRHKVRYRWYGQSDLPIAGKLEVKCRRNVYGWKKAFDIKKIDIPENSRRSLSDFRKSLLLNLNREERVWLENNPQPVILNRYKRKYFISSDSKVRITVDTELTVYDQRYKPYVNTRRKANIPKTIIVEVKCDRKNRDLLSQVISGIPIRVSRNSKYVNAVTCINSF